MIGRLEGTILERSPGTVLLDVGGVGYDLQIPLSTFYRLAESRNGRVALCVHTHLREDALVLFGFATTEERGAFQDLIAVSGVGPRLALAVLSGLEVADLRRAIETGDRERLERVPGVGRKTAERILLELRDLRKDGRRRRAALAATAVGAPVPSAGGGTRADAVSALANLGYAADAADRAVAAALRERGDDAPLEDVLKAALRGLFR